MPTSPAALALWGKLLTHNKILSEAQWDTAQAALQHAGVDATIESVLLGQGMLRKAHVEQISARVTQLLGKAQAVAPPAPPKPAAPPPEPAKPTAPAKPAEETDELMPVDSPTARGRKSSDTEWVETTDDTRAAIEFKSKDIEAIDVMESDAPAGNAENKKIWTPTPGQWNKPMTGPVADGTGTRSKDIPQIPLEGEE
jgi:hypothetical protein